MLVEAQEVCEGSAGVYAESNHGQHYPINSFYRSYMSEIGCDSKCDSYSVVPVTKIWSECEAMTR